MKNKLTKIPNKDIIDSWDRTRFPSFIKYLQSDKYKKFVEEYRKKNES